MAMPVDPHTLHVYWSFHPLKARMLARYYDTPSASMPLVLRLEPAEEGGAQPMEIEVELASSQQRVYVRDLPAGHGWQVQLGVRTPEGGTVVVLEGGPVRTPRASAQDTPPGWHNRAAGNAHAADAIPPADDPPVAREAGCDDPSHAADWTKWFDGYSLRTPLYPFQQHLREEDGP
ncbi:DUF4912 domain-containing protein [Alicyclobacillus sp.]|uniref:DUF4912 domain-containing protein n=1 Tax=Alicyclobacillus sp. TaxID=61169 RepID=UPI0025C3E842|nr:DUF4912 domain-containing protein [Alicyclobacillus sp.]MCL6515561.1 DUF4912 domain-containing protein [Alicyclobacillus sp.]